MKKKTKKWLKKNVDLAVIINLQKQKMLSYQPDIDDVKKRANLINIFGGMWLHSVNNISIVPNDIEDDVHRFYACVDLLMRLEYAYMTIGGRVDLLMSSKLIELVIKRWKHGIPLVEWNCEGFKGMKS